jgi:DNA-binding response OmpR family regulator
VLRRYQHDDGPAASLTGQPKDEHYDFDGFVLSIPRRELTDANGRVIELTAAEFNLLKLLVTRPTRVMTRDNIMDALKGHEWSPLDRSIDTLVARLRKKIEGDTEHPRLIKTVRGVGYVFAAEVRKA